MRRSIALMTEKNVIDKAKEKLAGAAGAVKEKVKDMKDAAGQKMKDAGIDIKEGDTAKTAMNAGQKLKNAGMEKAGESIKHGDTANTAGKAGEHIKQAGEKMKSRHDNN